MTHRGDGYYTAHSGFSEWYTPKWVINKVVSVIGDIDFDPYSHDVANQIVNAKQYMTKEQDALIGEWPEVQTVFANPPYAHKYINLCVDKLIDQYMKGRFRQAMILVNNATETSWFHELIAMSTHMVVFRKRISFVNPLIAKSNPNTRGQVLFLMNRHDKYPTCQDMYMKLVEHFSDNGFVCRLYDCDCDDNW